MASQKWLFCKYCYKDQIFEWKFKSHGWSGWHEEWHCITCESCDYDVARNH